MQNNFVIKNYHLHLHRKIKNYETSEHKYKISPLLSII